MTTRQKNFSQLAPSCRRKAIETKIKQNLVFDPSGYLGRLRGCLFLGVRHALLHGACFAE